MSWTVQWTPSAAQQLARIWTDASDKLDVTNAADFIDTQLARDPFHLSESREEETRIMVIPPLAVGFNVDDINQKVRVWVVWRWGST